MSAELIKEFKTKIKKSIKSNYHIDEALKIINQLPDELKDKLLEYAWKKMDICAMCW
jgi:hypothetical protein